MKNLITRLIREDEGQGMVEYGILIAGIAVVAMVAVYTLGDVIRTEFNKLSKQLNPAFTSPPAAIGGK